MGPVILFILGEAVCMTVTFLALKLLYRRLDKWFEKKEVEEEKRIYENYINNGKLE